MAHFIFISGTAKGHVNPLIGVAQELKLRGHSVCWLCIPHKNEQIEKGGIEAVSLFDSYAESKIPLAGQALAEVIGDSEQLTQWLRALLITPTELTVPYLQNKLRELGPDIVLFDPMLFSAPIACYLEGIKHIGISSGLNPVTPANFHCQIVDKVRELAPEREKLFAKLGMNPRFSNWEYLSPDGTLVFSTEEYVLEEVDPSVKLVGPSVSLISRGDEVNFPMGLIPPPPVPLLYVSFGSQIFWQPEFFDKILRVVSDLPLFTVLSAGELASRYQNIPNVLAVSYVPQREILKRAQVFISHGGANSVMEALYSNVPLLLNPICSDQPLQGQFLEKAKAGRVINLNTISDADLKLEICNAIERKNMPRLDKVNQSYQAANGSKNAADYIESFLL